MAKYDNIPDEVWKKHVAKCKNCPERIVIARMVDMHFDWLDCPYDCENDIEHYWDSQVGIS